MDQFHNCECINCSKSNLLSVLGREGYQKHALGSVAVDDSIEAPPWFDREKYKR